MPVRGRIQQEPSLSLSLFLTIQVPALSSPGFPPKDSSSSLAAESLPEDFIPTQVLQRPWRQGSSITSELLAAGRKSAEPTDKAPGLICSHHKGWLRHSSLTGTVCHSSLSLALLFPREAETELWVPALFHPERSTNTTCGSLLLSLLSSFLLTTNVYCLQSLEMK